MIRFIILEGLALLAIVFTVILLISALYLMLNPA